MSVGLVLILQTEVNVDVFLLPPSLSQIAMKVDMDMSTLHYMKMEYPTSTLQVLWVENALKDAQEWHEIDELPGFISRSSMNLCFCCSCGCSYEIFVDCGLSVQLNGRAAWPHFKMENTLIALFMELFGVSFFFLLLIWLQLWDIGALLAWRSKSWMGCGLPPLCFLWCCCCSSQWFLDVLWKILGVWWGC